jgi:small subunit ribosomal protein S20
MSVRPVIAVVDGDPEIDADPPVQAARSDSATAARQPARPLDPLMNPLVDSPARMANIKSQKKRNIQNEKRHQRNVATKSALKTSTKRVHAAAAAGDAEAATTGQREAARALDKAASRGILHRKTAARRKSRLARAANATTA